MADKQNWVEQAVANEPPAPEPEIEEQKPPAAEAPEAEPPDEPEGDGKASTTVPHAALHRERKLRQEAEKRERERAIEFARAEERLRIIQETWEKQQQAPAAQPEPAPDPNADPLGYVNHQLQEERRAREALEKQVREQQGLTEQQRQQAQITTRYSAAAREFHAKTPDFTDAYQHLWKELDQDLIDQGVADPNVRRNALMQDEIKFAHAMMAQGKNPAEVIYQWSKRRGFAGKATEPAPPMPPEEQVELQNRRNVAARSLSESGGRAPSNVTLKDIANMDADEFQKATSGKNWEKLLRQAQR